MGGLGPMHFPLKYGLELLTTLTTFQLNLSVNSSLQQPANAEIVAVLMKWHSYD